MFNNNAKVYTFKLVTYSLVVCCTSAQTLLLVQTHKYTVMCALGFTMSIFQLMFEFFVIGKSVFPDVYTVAIFDLPKLILWKYVRLI